MEAGERTEDVFNISRLYLYIDDKAILKNISVKIPNNSVFGIMGLQVLESQHY
jgi:hypothetical protein